VGAAIESSDIVICCLSKHAVESKWFKQELVEALAKREEADSSLVIIPCVLDETKAPPFLRDYLYIPLNPDTYRSSIRRLAMSIRSRFFLPKLDQIVKNEETRSAEAMEWRFDLDLD
jgi:3-dehydroquinate dehydratase